jgi:polyhydroxyalkanoate synthesis regulator phasin
VEIQQQQVFLQILSDRNVEIVQLRDRLEKAQSEINELRRQVEKLQPGEKPKADV